MQASNITKPIQEPYCLFRNEISAITENTPWHINKQKAQIIETHKFVEGTFRANTNSVIQISTELFRYLGGHHPDTHNFLRFSEYIPLNKKEKESLENLFSAHEERRIQKYYGSPGEHHIICSPIRTKLARTKHHQYGIFVPTTQFTELIGALEEKKNFIATKYKVNKLADGQEVIWYSASESKRKNKHEYVAPHSTDLFWNKLVK